MSNFAADFKTSVSVNGISGRSRAEWLRRYVSFIFILFIIAFGTSLSIRANLGSSPISAPPYVLSLVPGSPMTMGQFTICMHVFFILAQILLLRRDFERRQLTQILVSFLFGFYTDLTMWITGFLQVPFDLPLFMGYPLRFLELMAGGAILAFGIACEVRCDSLMLAGEGFPLAISKFVKKYNNNLSLIVTVSDLERESFLDEGYNYDENIIQVLGFPRFDNLTDSDDNKQILFMPTWRLQFDSDESFVNSDYFNSLEGLLNNGKLHKLLNKHGYKLVFKPHAELMRYIDLIDICEDVYLSLDDSYQDLFRDSSLLITDYSSVFFDFAYLKKPVIYYQSDDDYHYDDGYFVYESMGFGEVLNDEENLIKRIEEYLENECIMEEKFKENVDSFFKFIDGNNCKRVYKWILEH